MPFQHSNELAHDPLEHVNCSSGKKDLEGSPFFQNLVSSDTYMHYDQLIMSQKEAPMGAWVLPKKAAKMVKISVQLSSVEYDAPIITY